MGELLDKMVASLKPALMRKNKMALDETDKALIKSVEELIKKDIPDDPKSLLEAYKEASDLKQQLENKRQQYHEKTIKILEILPHLKPYFDLRILEAQQDGLSFEDHAQLGELWSSFTSADRERVKEIDELYRTREALSTHRLDRDRLKPIRLKAFDQNIVLDEVKFEVRDKEHYTSFTFDGKRYDVGSSQGQAIKLLHEEGEAGRPDVPIADIKKVMGLPQRSTLRDSFRKKGLWRTLIVINKKKTCRLSIFS